jgi:Holliday junction resolvasome RuvABC endonuclease subunit
MAKQMTYWWTDQTNSESRPVKPNRILAIDPGTRYNGLAVLDDSELVYYAVKTVSQRRSMSRVLNCARQIVREMIGAYRPAMVAIEKPFLFHTSAVGVTAVGREMKKEAEDLGVSVSEYSPLTIRDYICGSGLATKSDVATAVAGRFPELERHLNYMNEWVEKYYSHIFDAIAAGLACQHDLNDKGYAAENLAKAA